MVELERRCGEQRETPDLVSGITDRLYWAQEVISCYGQRAVWPQT